MILFSPIGTADPITALGDGPMLHIVRHYRPTVVVLFLSAEIAAFENADRRYSAAITRLAPETDVRAVIHTDPSVHRFDLFVPIFRDHLAQLSSEFPDTTILLNTSSGTPAMQAALVAINVFGIPRTTAVQVSTPARASSKPGDRESPDTYDLELMWDANDDNEPAASNRCFETTSAALGALLERANLKQLIASYDYSAAVTIAADSRLPDHVSNLIRGAMHRSRLEHLVAPRFFKGTVFTYDPANKVAEYVSALALLAKREQWAEFARAATPAITIVLRAAVAKHLPEDRYLDDMGRVDRRKLEREPEIRCALKHPPKSPNAEWYLYTKDWLALLRQFAPDRVGALEVLGRFESRVRNTAAHEIVSISEDRITKDGGLLPEQLLKILARETGADLTLYDRLNDEIIRQIDMAPLG
ncbi:type III-A CRISPR-associated CARF protein Csm6 [Mycobacterium canetti]|uniref:Type III-A CRISPR-associated CARF protein Csm6 n=1 Tax=Mycobacterium canetti TaxID=78331 RepID=A0ABV1MIY5_9MYCO|nr:type III-A CRISPR-associated CARF protein Csm6 [Mycobacterium canetti]MBA2787474.1 type III-A CRISPR-associated protein Csm6 [Mycobacterium canetti]